MSKRAVSLLSVGAPSEDESGANKRQRVNEQAAVSFYDINNDCKVNILSYLSAEDMNSFAICSRDCRRVRAHESLDQTRTGTLIFTQYTSIQNMTIEYAGVFTGNRTRLKIVGEERSAARPPTRRRTRMMHPDDDEARLEGVTSLDCSYNGTATNRSIPCALQLSILGHLLPNLQAMDFSNIPIHSSETWAAVGMFCIYSPNLTKFTWNGGSKVILFCGDDFGLWSNLSYLCLDDSVFDRYARKIDPQHETEIHNQILASDNPEYYLLMRCSRLECLSLKGASMNVGEEETEPLPQRVLIDMVRRHATLRWLRSDLTAENVAMLKQERPEITFVTA